MAPTILELAADHDRGSGGANFFLIAAAVAAGIASLEIPPTMEDKE